MRPGTIEPLRIFSPGFPGLEDAMGKDALGGMLGLLSGKMFLSHSQRLGIYESLPSLPGKKGRQGLQRLFYMTLKSVP